MIRIASMMIAALSVLALVSPALEAKPKKGEGLKVLFESTTELPEGLRPAAEMTTMTREELDAAGYVATARVHVESVVQVCKFKKDDTTKCKDVKKIKDGREELLALVLKNGGGLVLMDAESEERQDAVLGKSCVHWRPNATNAVPDCAQWVERKVGYELIRVQGGTVWNLIP
jgi:hypothetical protein